MELKYGYISDVAVYSTYIIKYGEDGHKDSCTKCFHTTKHTLQ